MHDCFNMAYHGNANPLQLHIKVNSENLLPVPEKYNAGSLRIPADPSWPKIPQRKLADEATNIIESPYVVTLTGTPRRSRTVVRTPLNQSPKPTITNDAYSCSHHQRASSCTHTVKRAPGCVDPRFKKVTSVKNNQISSASGSVQERDSSRETNRSIFTAPTVQSEETEKPIPERDINTQQVTTHEAEKPDEARRIDCINTRADLLSRADRDTESCIETEKTHLDSREKNNCGGQSTTEQKCCIDGMEIKKRDNAEDDTAGKNDVAEKKDCVNKPSCYQHASELKSLMNDANTQAEITPLPVQENNGKLFFVVDKNLQSHPIGAIHVDTIAIPQECAKQCYNVQVPVLTYQNIPVQISADVRKSVIHQDPPKKAVEDKTVSDNRHTNTTRIQSTDPNIPEKLENVQIPRKPHESSDSEYYIPNVIKKSVQNNALRRLTVKKIICNSTAEETTDSEGIEKRDIAKRKSNFDCISVARKVKETEANLNKYEQTDVVGKQKTGFLRITPRFNFPSIGQDQTKTFTYETKPRNKSEQNLPCIENGGTRKLLRSSEPYITIRQKKAKLSRKARSYFQKNSHCALMDSDYTMIWPNCQYGKRKRSQSNVQKYVNHRIRKLGQHSNTKLCNHGWSRVMHVQETSNFIEKNIAKKAEDTEPCRQTFTSVSETCVQKENCKCDTSPRTVTEDTTEKKGIPLKTQELLNKSYWEYYNKLRHKATNVENSRQEYHNHLAIEAPEIKRKKADELYDKDLKNQSKVTPEIQTLQQCSALSSMINKALDPNLQPSDPTQTKQLYINGNMKSSSDPTAGTQSGVIKKLATNLIADEYDGNATTPIFITKVKRKREKRNDKQFLELKTIIFFGSMMYILIIFLPMLYDYFYHEEYDDYENLSYVELIVEYVWSSFREAFGGFFGGVQKIFFHPRTCKKCSSVA